MTSAYFYPLIFLPKIIDHPSRYLTRCGERVTVHTVSHRHNFGCRGTYSDGIAEGWHHTGRILHSRETENDIVSACAPEGGQS